MTKSPTRKRPRKQAAPRPEVGNIDPERLAVLVAAADDLEAMKARQAGTSSELWVLFSYAWLEGGRVAKQQHRVQDDFFKELERQLTYRPTTYEDLPPIRLWRDQQQIHKTDQGGSQIHEACRRAFLGLIMLSDKYPHSPGCMMEADYFLTKVGRNKAGKSCLIVPVNISHSEAPPRFSTGIRIWADYQRQNLIGAWEQSTKRGPLVKFIATEIFAAARRYIAVPPKTAGAAHPAARSVDSPRAGQGAPAGAGIGVGENACRFWPGKDRFSS
jgi:hypothetical protein